MKKVITIISLLLVIVFFAGVVVFAAESRGSSDNFINRTVRYRVARSQTLRTIFSLHNDGDGRTDYLGTATTRISIRIGLIDNIQIPDSVWQEFAAKVQSITGKQATYEVVGPRLQTMDAVSAVEGIAVTSKAPSTAYVYIVVASSNPENADTLGLTYNENGIILYNSALEAFTESTPATYTTYAMSTLLHEFGHQLGLPHNSEPGCLMTEHAELEHFAKRYAGDVVTDFCELEKEQLHIIKY